MCAHTRKDRHSQRLGLLLIDFSRVRRRLSSATSNTQTCRALFFVLRCFDGVVLQHSNVVLPRRRSPERWLPFAKSFIVVGLLSLRLLTSVLPLHLHCLLWRPHRRISLARSLQRDSLWRCQSASVPVALARHVPDAQTHGTAYWFFGPPNVGGTPIVLSAHAAQNIPQIVLFGGL